MKDGRPRRLILGVNLGIYVWIGMVLCQSSLWHRHHQTCVLPLCGTPWIPMKPDRKGTFMVLPGGLPFYLHYTAFSLLCLPHLSPSCCLWGLGLGNNDLKTKTPTPLNLSPSLEKRNLSKLMLRLWSKISGSSSQKHCTSPTGPCYLQESLGGDWSTGAISVH